MDKALLIIGGASTLGSACARCCTARGLTHLRLGRHELDFTDAQALTAAFERYQPWAVVNVAGYDRVDDAELEPAVCEHLNTEACVQLAEACAARGIRLATYSSDLVFNGMTARPYVESDTPRPLNAYGRSKAAAEAGVLAALPAALVIRTSAWFGPWDEDNFLMLALRTLAAKQTFTAVADVTLSPTYVPDLVNASLDLLLKGEHGLWHLANQGAVTWAEFARLGAACAGLPADKVEERPLAALGLRATRPHYSVLGSERGGLLRPLSEAVECYVRECFPSDVAAHASP
jgi:dTDP-4-dehydrorhamnose reductase